MPWKDPSTSGFQRSLEERIEGVMTEKSYRDYDGINGEPTEFEWNIFPGFTTLQLCGKVNDLLSNLGETPETFTRWSFIGPGSEKKRYSTEEMVHKELGIILRTKCCWNSQKADILFPCNDSIVSVKSQKQRTWKTVDSYCADQKTIETIFRIIAFANQLSLYGAVANMCEEFEFHQDRSGQPDVLMGQSIVLSEIKAEVPLENDIPLHQNLLLQRYEERIEMLSQEHKVSKFCMEAGLKRIVEVGQYSMTKDTGDFTKIHTVACRVYTLPRDDGSSQPRGWIQGNSRIGPVLEVTTSYMYGKHGIEIRIWSLSQDNSHSWVRISHGLNKHVVDSNYNNANVPADLPEEQASQSSVKVVAARSKAKAKPQKRETVELPSTIPMNERKWIDIEPAESFLSLRTRSRRKSSIFFDTVKRYNEKMTEQFNSGEPSFIFGINFHKTNIGRMIVGKHAWQQEEDQKEDMLNDMILSEMA